MVIKFKDFEWNFKIIAVLILISVLNWFLFSSFKIRVYYTIIPALLALQLFFNNLIEYFLILKVKNTRWFTLLVAPGTILHEISHAVAALITGCKITSISLFSFNKNTGVLGSVNYLSKQDRFSFLREVLIIFSPFFGCSFAMILISKYFFQQPITIDFFQVSFTSLLYQIIDSVKMLVNQYSQLAIDNPMKAIALYLQLCFAFGAAPSGFDFKGLSLSLRKNILGFLIAIFVVVASAFLVQYPDYSGVVSDFLLSLFNWIVLLLSLSITLIIFSLILVYSISIWFDAGLLSKAVSIVVFILAYYLTLPSLNPKSTSLLVSWIAFVAVLFLAKNSHLFIREQHSG